VTDWLEGERIRSVWTGREALLVITNLRVLVLWEGDGLFRESGWHLGREFLFSNFGEPTVDGAHHLRLIEEFPPRVAERFAVDDPPTLRAALEEAVALGKVEWARRRRQALPSLAAPRPPDPRVALAFGATAPSTAREPCRYCGNRIPTATDRCPFCAAPLRPSRRAAPER
jgi:hypothetical protein